MMRKIKPPPVPREPKNFDDACALIKELYAHILVLHDALNQNSSNSSKPPSSDTNKDKSKDKGSEGKEANKKNNNRKPGAQKGHQRHKREPAELKESDKIVDCFPESHCAICNGEMKINESPSYRHQVFELPKMEFDITEYRIYHAHCQHCGHTTKSELLDDASPYQIGSELQAFIAVLACELHLSLSKTQQILQDLFGSTFSIGALNEAKLRTGQLLKPITEMMS